MKSSSAFTRLGTTACTCLAPGERGKIFAAFSNAIYLLTEAGELFWITTEAAPLHRRCAQTTSPLPRLAAGSSFQVQSHGLLVDTAYVFGFKNIAVWRAPRVKPGPVWEIAKLSDRVQIFFTGLDCTQATGFGAFIPHILSLSQGTAAGLLPESADPILSYARLHVLDMARACVERQSARLSQNANALIGLGPGLTPSGDDFLGGLLFALKSLQAAYPGSYFAELKPRLEALRSRTHLISFTLLQDLADGQAIAPLHFIINGLLGGESLDSLTPYISELTQLGHSTGWDLLTGLLAGLLTTYQSNYFISASPMIHHLED